jgi:glycosyltransferase involved in cell wall biosynthesis
VRIVIATSHRGLWGGVEKYLESMIPTLIQRGHSVGLLYEYPLHANQEGIDSAAGRVPSWCSSELGVDSVLHSLQTWAPDVVYSHGLDNSELERSLLDSYPAALYAHTYYGTCVSGRKCHSWPRIQPCDRKLGAGCLALYYPRRCGGLNPRTMWQLFQLQSKRKSTLPDYQAVLVASRHMHSEYQQHGVPTDRLHLVPLPTDGPVPGAVAPRPGALGYRILFVGRLIDVKGVSHLLRAMPLAAAKLGRALTLTIAGDGPERGKIEDLAQRLDLTVEFAGWVDSERRSDLMRQADLVAVPSLWPEPFGLVGIEAGSLGVPAVGFAVGGIPDWLIPGESGELAPGDPATAEGLAEALVRAFADPGHYQKLCVGAWEMAKRFTLERHIAQLEQILSVATSARQLIPSSV